MTAQNECHSKPGLEYVLYTKSITNIIISSCQWPEEYNLASNK